MSESAVAGQVVPIVAAEVLVAVIDEGCAAAAVAVVVVVVVDVAVGKGCSSFSGQAEGMKMPAGLAPGAQATGFPTALAAECEGSSLDVEIGSGWC